MTICLMFVYIIFGSVWHADWPGFGKELLTLCILNISNFSHFPYWFYGLNLGFIASVPGPWFYFTHSQKKQERARKRNAFPLELLHSVYKA